MKCLIRARRDGSGVGEMNRRHSAVAVLCCGGLYFSDSNGKELLGPDASGQQLSAALSIHLQLGCRIHWRLD